MERRRAPVQADALMRQRYVDDSLHMEAVRRLMRRTIWWMRWTSKFVRKDPRRQLLAYFRSLAAQGDAAAAHEEEPDFMIDLSASFRAGSSSSLGSSSLHGLPIFNKAAVFAIFRPTSRESIRKMMVGEAVGKGLNIKGKSAKKGKLSALVPFMQIHDEADKKKASFPPRTGRIRLFYANEESREKVREYLERVGDEMSAEVLKAKRIVDRGEKTNDIMDQQSALERLVWEVEDPLIHLLDAYAPDYWGLDVPERVFYEACINRQDISRPPGCPFETGRASAPPFQDMNFHATRHYDGVGPRPVVFQMEEDPKHALQPQSLVMAYEENEKVKPVASDFDSFVIGTRRIAYREPLPPEQIELLHWLLDNIEGILDTPSSDSWTHRWFEVLKKAAVNGFHPVFPRFGFGDPMSYSIIEGAVHRTRFNGGVRHGSECFNYYFPQELDDEFFVISDLYPEKPWSYLCLKDIQEILYTQVTQGFSFPLNPKWILCDPGWYKIYDAMLRSTNPTIAESIDIWYPVESGIRAKIARIHAKHPEGFVTVDELSDHGKHKRKVTGTEAMDLASFELKSYLKKKRAKLKLKMMLLFLAEEQRIKRRRAEKEAAEEEARRKKEEAETDFFMVAVENAVRHSSRKIPVIPASLLEGNGNGELEPLQEDEVHESKDESTTPQVETKKSNSVRLQIPTVAELNEVVEEILRKNPDMEEEALHKKVLEDHEDWRVPRQRVTKFIKRKRWKKSQETQNTDSDDEDPVFATEKLFPMRSRSTGTREAAPATTQPTTEPIVQPIVEPTVPPAVEQIVQPTAPVKSTAPVVLNGANTVSREALSRAMSVTVLASGDIVLSPEANGKPKVRKRGLVDFEIPSKEKNADTCVCEGCIIS